MLSTRCSVDDVASQTRPAAAVVARAALPMAAARSMSLLNRANTRSGRSFEATQHRRPRSNRWVAPHDGDVAAAVPGSASARGSRIETVQHVVRSAVFCGLAPAGDHKASAPCADMPGGHSMTKSARSTAFVASAVLLLAAACTNSPTPAAAPTSTAESLVSSVSGSDPAGASAGGALSVDTTSVPMTPVGALDGASGAGGDPSYGPDPTPSNFLPSPSAASPSPMATPGGLSSAAATPARPGGFTLTGNDQPLGVTTDGNIVVNNGTNISVYDRTGKQTWTAAAPAGATPIVVGDKLYLLGSAQVPPSGLSTGGTVTTLAVYGLNDPGGKAAIILPKGGLPGNAVPSDAGPGVKWVFDGVAYLLVQDQQGGDPTKPGGVTKIVLQTGATSTLTAPAGDPGRGLSVQIEGIDNKGGLVTFAFTPPELGGATAGELSSPNWPSPVKIRTQIVGDGIDQSGLKPMDSDGRIAYTTIPAGDAPAGGSNTVSTMVDAPTQIIDRAGKTVLTTRGFAPTVWSPDRSWAAGNDGIVNTKTGKTYMFPATGTTVAPNFFAVGDDGVALSKGADDKSVVRINPVTRTVKTLSGVDFAGVETFGGWVLYTGSSTQPSVLVPPAGK